jgi:glycosyltransferase involved in cell wall biosynthesis
VGLHVVEVFEGEVGHGADLLVRELSQRGVSVDVVCPPPAATRFEHSGARVTPLSVAAVSGVAALRRVLRTDGVDLVHAHGLPAGLAASLARSGTTPLVLTWTDPVPEGGAAGLAGWALARTAVSAAELTLAGSADLVATAARLGARDVRPAPILLPGPAPSTRTPAEVREELALDPDAPLILASGRLHTQSRLDVLVAASARWRYRHPVPEVVLAGVGPAYRDLAAQAVVARAPVTFAGEREAADAGPVGAPNGGPPHGGPPPEAGPDAALSPETVSAAAAGPAKAGSDRATLIDLIRSADIGVITSARARPLFALQAAQVGVALVVPAGGVVAQLLGTGAAQFPQDDVDALDATVRGLLDDRTARAVLASAGAAQARTWPRVDVAVGQIVALYAELSEATRDAPSRR